MHPASCTPGIRRCHHMGIPPLREAPFESQPRAIAVCNQIFRVAFLIGFGCPEWPQRDNARCRLLGLGRQKGLLDLPTRAA